MKGPFLKSATHAESQIKSKKTMANVFGILTAIVLALAAFVAYKNKNAYEKELADRKTSQETLAASQDQLAKLEGDLESTKKDLADTEAKVESSKAQEAQQKAANDKLVADIDAKKPELEANKAKLDAIREQVERVGPIKDLAAKMRTILAEGEELTQAVDEGEAKLANLMSENSRVEAIVNEQKTESDLLSKGQSFPDLKTRIRSVYPNWGFVTLAAGNTSGVVTNSTLDVVRNGETVAKLLVTAVESNTSSASIIPDSVVEGTTLAAGDQVVPGAK